MHLDGNNTKVRVRVATHFQGITELVVEVSFWGSLAAIEHNHITYSSVALFLCLL